ncbi:PREDICTED: tctex1 domain-containing protein 1-like isoform X2 [Wasmannia auropunctata]|nr:PREDICTED: tctex1 domain-containing protein 1-like isoform X2 [Wasmannia auropunctata]XP_011699172.1 PREDICTED: tctex1 domain-containing protein 1-like isoform X2 [Wasmannia auropunctata]
MSRAWSILGRAVRSKTYINNLSLSKIRKSTLLARKSSLKTPRFQNTYRLEACKPLKSEVIDMILIDVMQDYLTGVKYHPQVCMQLCQRISEEVRDKICKKFYDRYKIVVIMSIVQKLGQSVRMDFGKLWDVERDTFSTYVIETAEFAAMGLVVGTYYE